MARQLDASAGWRTGHGLEPAAGGAPPTHQVQAKLPRGGPDTLRDGVWLKPVVKEGESGNFAMKPHFTPLIPEAWIEGLILGG